MESTRELLHTIRAKRNVDSHDITVISEQLMRVGADAVEHLKLKPVATNPLPLDKRLRCLDQTVVVRGDAGVTRVRDEHLSILDDSLAARRHILICNG